MRTRRSPRNQEILWRELGRQGAVAPELAAPARICFNCRHYPKHGRDRGVCGLLGTKIYGRTPDAPCFVEKAGVR